MARKTPGDSAKAGRPRLIDAAKREQLLKKTRYLGSLKQAAAACELSYPTLWRAIKADPEFETALLTAKERFKAAGVRAIRQAGKTDPKAWQWLLERIYPEEFGRRNAETMKIADVILLINQIVAVAFQGIPAKYLKKVQTSTNKILEQVVSGKGASADLE